MTDSKALLKDIAAYTKAFFRKHANEKLVFHNLVHTQDVVNNCKEISRHYFLSEQNHFIVLTAAWFHDTGHLLHDALGHEEVSVNIMQAYCNKAGIEAGITEQIKNCILATKLTGPPKSSLNEKIICDADLYHLGTPEFVLIDQLVKKEIELRTHCEIKHWNESSLHFLKTHVYYTTYCTELLSEGKLHNIQLLEEKINRLS